MNRHFTKLAGGLALAFTLAVGGVPDRHVTQKAAMIEGMVQDSLRLPCANTSQNEADRLRTILMPTPVKDIQTLKDNSLTICLDQRLAGTGMAGILYQKEGIVTLWDNGKPFDADRAYLFHGPESAVEDLTSLTAQLRDGEIPPEEPRLYAVKFYTVHMTRWNTENHSFSKTIDKTPHLKKPPVGR